MQPEELTHFMQNLCICDRDIYEKSVKAFVSWCRYYKEHRAFLIFKFSELMLSSVAKMFGLIKLPKMPELNNASIDFTPLDIDVNSIKYKNAAREKKRLATIKTLKVVKKIENPRSVPWSKQKELKRKKQLKAEPKVVDNNSISKKQNKTKSEEFKNDIIDAEFMKMMQEEKAEKKKKLIKRRNRTDINLDWNEDQGLPINAYRI